MANKLKVTLFFDCISPYSYLCWQSLLNYKTIWNLQLDIKPVFLGGIMQSTGNQPPAMLAPRAAFVGADVERNAAMFGVKLLPTPPNFFSEAARKVLTIQRLLTGRIVDNVQPEELERLVSACFHALHGETKFRTEDNNLIINDEVIIKIMLSIGMSEASARTSLKRAGDADVKKALLDNTKEAVDAGAYGAPTLLIHGGKAPFYDGKKPWLVFGSDRLEQIGFVCGLPYHGVNPKNNAKL